jgi:hypothetical protein
MSRIWKPHAFSSFKPYAAYIFPTFDAQQHISEAMDHARILLPHSTKTKVQARTTGQGPTIAKYVTWTRRTGSDSLREMPTV